jgi:hypothetical protein
MVGDVDNGADVLVLGLSRNDLPPMYRSASGSSRHGQRRTVRWSAVQLSLLAAGALLGGVDAKISGGVQLGALAAAIALAASLIPAVWLARTNPQRSWYRGRAGAESIKTLVWKYAVRAEPFAGENTRAHERLITGLTQIKRDLSDIGWHPEAGGDTEITQPVRALRGATLSLRRDAYLAGRIDIERWWYRTKARHFARVARWWTAAALVATAVGLAAGFLRAFGVMSYDGLGAASAIAAAATAWLQLKQFRPLTAAYALTADELDAVRAGLVDIDDEAVWAHESHHAEEAISREHTMWLARREAI